MSRRIIVFLLAAVLLIPAAISYRPGVAHAAANLSIGGGGTFTIGDTITLSILVSTSQSANAFQGTVSYPTAIFNGIRGSFSGSICTLPISEPDPSGGTATFSCGRPSGFSGTGTVATVTLQAIATGSGNFGLSGCSVLANDGQGTDITGGCSGTSFTVGASQPTPTPTPAPTLTVTTPQPTSSNNSTTSKPTPTPVHHSTPAPTPTPSLVPAETPKSSAATPTPTPPPVQTLAPTPSQNTTTQATTTDTSSAAASNSQPRTIGQAIQAIFASSKDIKNLHTSPAGVIALMVTTIPFLSLVLAIVFLGYRLYIMERRRRRTLDRLFEMELSELAALEGKIDLLAEKGQKGREQYKEEFGKAKENILRQLKPGFGKPIDPEPAAKKVEPPAEK